MLAKLFNNISIQSLVRALGFSLLVVALVPFLQPPPEVRLALGATGLVISPVSYAFLFGLVLFVTAWWLNSSINALGFLKNDVQFTPVFTLVFLPAYFVFSPELVLVLPLGALVILRLLSIAKGAEEAYALFDAGSLIGLMAIVVPETILFLLACWIATLSLGKIYFRAFLIPVVGIAATWFVVFTLLYWFSNNNINTIAEAIIAQVDIGYSPEVLQEYWWKFAPVALVALPALGEVLQVYSKANNYKRRSFTFLIVFFILFLLAGAFVRNHARLWMWLTLPMAVFLVNLIHYIRKSWMKDMVYLMLLLTLVLFLFFGS